MSAFLFGVPGKLKTLLDRLTSTRAGYLDNLDAAISTRAAASTALSTATWTGTRAGKLDEVGIKSIQYSYVDVTWTGTYVYGNTGTATLVTTVNASKALLVPLGSVRTDENQNSADWSWRITLTNSTTVTGEVKSNFSGDDSPTIRIYFVVVEFN